MGGARQEPAFSGRDGEIYAINFADDLMWLLHTGWQDGTNEWKVTYAQRVGQEWHFYGSCSSSAGGRVSTRLVTVEQVPGAPSFALFANGENMVRPERFELPTFWFVARRSIQLS